MNLFPLVSVLLSVYDGEETIDRCLASVIGQTYQNIEIICVNDCSSDSTSKKLKIWLEKIGVNRLKVISNEKNLGLTRSLNISAKHASGCYYARIDADDVWLPNKIEKQVNYLENHQDIGLVGTLYINDDGQHQRKVMLPICSQDIKKTIISRNPFGHSCVVFRKEIFNRLGGYDEGVILGQDWDLWLRFFAVTEMVNLPEFLCHRNHGGISINKQKQQMWQAIKTKCKYIKKYNMSPMYYLELWEPLFLILFPEKLKLIIKKCF